MTRTFPQPEKKETPTQKLKRELAEAEAQRDGYQKEASDLRKQINGKLEETDSYKNLVKQVDSLTLDRNTAIKQRDRYHAKVQQLEDERDTLRKQLADLQATYEAQSAAESVPDAQAIEVPKVAQNGTQGGTEAIVEPLPDNVRNDEDEDDEPIDEESEELIENIVAYLKEAYANENKSISNTRAKANVRYWRKTAEGRKQFDILIEYFEGRLSATKRQMQAQNEKIQDLELQAKDRESTKQFNATMGNYAALSELSKQLKAKQVELDASVTAQNALKSDLDKLAAKYMQATQHNARNAGRKPKLTADQEQEIKNLRSEGFNVRQIAAKMSCSTGLVCKILKNCINS